MSKRKLEQLTIRVEGGRSAQFPIDMLRYDRGSPYHESDSYAIMREGTKDDPPRRSVELVVTACGAPTAARWESFGWRVTHVRDEASGDWQNYVAGLPAHRVWR